MYGTEWCSDCRRSKAVLEGLGVAYEFIDIEAVPEAATAAEGISGRKSTPVIVFPDGTFQVEPSDSDLKTKLAELKALSE